MTDIPSWLGDIVDALPGDRPALGNVWASFSEHDGDEDSAIQAGEIEGSGLLGAVIEAIHELTAAVYRFTEIGKRDDLKRLDEAWRGVYAALKAIEERG